MSLRARAPTHSSCGALKTPVNLAPRKRTDKDYVPRSDPCAVRPSFTVIMKPMSVMFLSVCRLCESRGGHLLRSCRGLGRHNIADDDAAERAFDGVANTEKLILSVPDIKGLIASARPLLVEPLHV